MLLYWYDEGIKLKIGEHEGSAKSVACHAEDSLCGRCVFACQRFFSIDLLLVGLGLFLCDDWSVQRIYVLVGKLCRNTSLLLDSMFEEPGERERVLTYFRNCLSLTAVRLFVFNGNDHFSVFQFSSWKIHLQSTELNKATH